MNYARLEPICGIIRIYDKKIDDSIHNTGIPYKVSVTIRWISTDTAEIMGLSQNITPSIWRAIYDECIDNWGIKKIIYTRYKDGKLITKTVRQKSGMSHLNSKDLNDDEIS